MAFVKMQAWVATPTALFAGSVGFSGRGKTHGSQSALTVATDANFIRVGELEKLMGYSHENGTLMEWRVATVAPTEGAHQGFSSIAMT